MTLSEALKSAGQPLRRSHAIARVMPWLTMVVLSFALCAWMIRLGWGGAPRWVILAWILGVVATAIGLLRIRAGLAQMAPIHLALLLENAGSWRRGALTTLLAPLAPGTSAMLHGSAADRETTLVMQTGQQSLTGELLRERSSIRQIGTVLLVGLVALMLARPLSSTSAVLWQPWRAVRALAAPVSLESNHVVVDRGERASLSIEAFGQRSVTLSTRAPGEEWQHQEVQLDLSGRATFETEPLEAELVARASAGGRRSDEVRVAIRLPAFLGSFTVLAHYPDYLALEDESLPLGSDTLLVPEGTELVLSGRATTALAAVHVVSPHDSVEMEVETESFKGQIVPQGTSTYKLLVQPTQGGVLEGEMPAVVIRVVPDTAPIVTVPVPGQDTVAPASHRLPIVIAVEDDHGIRSVLLETRQNSTDTPIRTVLQLGNGVTDRALLSAALDLDSLGLNPGDTLRYRAVATDNAPVPRVGRSDEYLVVVPTLAEERAARGAATEEAGRGLDSLAMLARRAQQQTDDLSRERQRSDPGAGTDPEHPDPLSAEAARRAEQAAETQDEIERQLDEMQRQLDQLEEAASSDPGLQEELAEIRRLLDEAMSPELKEAMKELRESLQNLDASDTQRSLEDLAAQQEKMRDAIERAKELFERAKAETELANLAEEAGELEELQDAATEELAADSTGGAEMEDALAERADSLAAALDDAAERMLAEQSREGLQQAAQQARQAATEMRKASSSAKRGRRQEAQQQAKAAGEALQPLEDQIKEERDKMQEEMKREVMAALDRLLQETTQAMEQQQILAEALRRGAVAGQIRAEETMLEEATSKLLQQVITVAGMNALISPSIADALAGAREGMRQAIQATSSASPSLGLAADRAGEAVDMLAVAVHALLRSQQSVAESESGSGLEEAMQQMQQMAGQQGELSDQGKSMLQQGDPGMTEMMQMAIQQRAMAQQLERMQAEGDMPGAGELAQEAKDIARSFELGRLTPETIARQERLFKRMLDAGRSLEGEEEDDKKERQSEAAESTDGSNPDQLDPALLRGAEFPIPSWDELQRLSPDERRRVLDYFRRLAERRTP